MTRITPFCPDLPYVDGVRQGSCPTTTTTTKIKMSGFEISLPSVEIRAEKTQHRRAVFQVPKKFFPNMGMIGVRARIVVHEKKKKKMTG